AGKNIESADPHRIRRECDARTGQRRQSFLSYNAISTARRTRQLCLSWQSDSTISARKFLHPTQVCARHYDRRGCHQAISEKIDLMIQALQEAILIEEIAIGGHT